MRADYDLVIIGDSYSARWAALTAAKEHARVALVRQTELSGMSCPFVYQALADVTAIAGSQGFSLPFETIGELRQWLQQRSQELFRPLSFRRLGGQGVDVISAPGQFIETQFKSPVFAAQNRQLRSRCYLLALPTTTAPEASTLKQTFSLPSCLDALEKWPLDQTVWFESPPAWGITLAQILKQFGYSVGLSFPETLLPQVDRDISFFVQCVLESYGIRVQRGGEFCERTVSSRFRLQSTIDYRSLKLELAGLSLDSSGLFSPATIKPTFQTTHPRIYDVSVTDDQSADWILKQTAIALSNSLFQTREVPSTHHWASQYPLGVGGCRVGLTEYQARQQFSKIEVMNRALENSGNPIFCKLIATTHGKIVGIHLVGPAVLQAKASMGEVLAKGLTVNGLDESSMGHPLLTQIMKDFSHRWTQIKSPKTRDRRERYFRAKRKRFS